MKAAKGDFDGALADDNRAIELDPEYALPYGSRALIKAVKGDLDGAIADATRAIELDPKYALPHGTRANIKAANGDMDGALADLTRAIELDPNFTDAYGIRGYIKEARGDLDGALSDDDRAIELNSGNALIYNNRGNVKRAKGDLDGAIADYNRAIELNPKYTVCYNNRGDAKKAKGDLEAAAVDFNLTMGGNGKIANPTASQQTSEVSKTSGDQSISHSILESKGKTDNNLNFQGERFPETRLRFLNVQDIHGWDSARLRDAINEMYARHGADFKDKKIKKYFQQFNWYHPRADKSYDDAETEFTEIEKVNVYLLGSYKEILKGLPSQSAAPGNPASTAQDESHPATSESGHGATQTSASTGQRYNGIGRIYKIPELKDIVGQQLNNAWLYGSFVYQYSSGNTIVVLTGMRIILVKEGSTEVCIDCVGGFNLRPETIEFFEVNLGQPPQPTFDVPRNDPLELLGVERTQNGKLRVFARYHGAIRL